jgi:hypothetical protein
MGGGQVPPTCWWGRFTVFICYLPIAATLGAALFVISLWQARTEPKKGKLDRADLGRAWCEVRRSLAEGWLSALERTPLPFVG